MSDSNQVSEVEVAADDSKEVSTSHSDAHSPSTDNSKQEVPSAPPGLDKIGIDLDSESSEDERSAFDRVRLPSDSEESDVEKPPNEIEDTSDTRDSPITSAEVTNSVAESNEQQSDPAEQEKVEDPPNDSEANRDVDSPELSDTPLADCEDRKNADDRDKAIPFQPGTDTSSNEKALKYNLQVREQAGQMEARLAKDSNRERDNRQSKENGYERKYEQNSNPRGDIVRRERDRGKGYRRDRDKDRSRRENFISYGHDDRFYADLSPRRKDVYGDFGMPHGNSPSSRQGRGGRGRGGEDRWKHDKFNEDEQGPITVEQPYPSSQRYDNNNNDTSISGSTFHEKKGRGRGKKQQYDDSYAPAPGYARSSPRQEQRGRGIRPRREDTDRFSGSRRPKGRGNSRYGYDDNEDYGFDLSKPIVFVSQNKHYDSSFDRDRSNRGSSLSSNELIKIGDSEYIQSDTSTPLPTIPILTSKHEIDAPTNDSKEHSSQMKYGGPYPQKYGMYSDTPGLISFAGVGRGKGKLLSKIAREQSGRESCKKGDPLIENDSRPPYKELSPLPAPGQNYSRPIKSKPQHYPAQEMKQSRNTNSNVAASDPRVEAPTRSTQEFQAKDQGTSKSQQETTHAEDIGKDNQAPPGKSEHSRQDKRSALADLKYSEFYPSPYKKEMVGNQVTNMQQFNFMPDGSIIQDYLLPPDVKDGDPLNPQSFHQIQFPPFMPQDMAMGMKRPPEMMGGVPYMGNPPMAPEYMLNEVPPNIQSDLFVPMPGFYPPI